MEERSWTVANWVGERRRANWTGRTKAFVLVGSSGLERVCVCVVDVRGYGKRRGKPIGRRVCI